jgi:anti-sigma factor RsiW
MRSPSFHDVEQLSAYLDGQLSPSERTPLESRIQSDPVLATALEELRQTRAVLQRTIQRRAPRNFTLTTRMAGIRPPVPRLYPVFSWASAVAMVLFIFTLGTNLVGQLSSGANVPMLAAAPAGMGGGPPAAATMAPANAAPATLAPAPLRTDQTGMATPPPEASVMPVPESLPPGVTRAIKAPSTPKAQHRPFTPWLVIWPGLALLLGTLALLVRWLNQRAFQRKNPPG